MKRIAIFKDYINGIIQILENNKLKFIGVYNQKNKLETIKIDVIDLNNLINNKLRLFFLRKINNSRIFFYIDFYKYPSGLIRLDLITSHFDLVEKENISTITRNMGSIVLVAKEMFMISPALYGLIGQEEISPDISSIINGKVKLPNYWAFYSKDLIDIIEKKKLLKILDGAYQIEELPGGGIFFAVSSWTNLPIKSKGRLKIMRLLDNQSDLIKNKLTTLISIS